MERQEFYDQLQKNPLPLVVDIWAPWCMPCRVMALVLDRLSAQYEGRVDVLKLNADESTDLVRSLGVRSIPTLIAYRDGRELSRLIGAKNQTILVDLFESTLAGESPAPHGLAPTQRMLRMFAGLSMFAIGWLSGPSLILLAIAGLVMFSAVYDRCPVWQALSPRLSQWLHFPQSTKN